MSTSASAPLPIRVPGKKSPGTPTAPPVPASDPVRVDPENTGETPPQRRRNSPQSLLTDLNPPQREAVLHAGSPVLVVAGAGSGKTRVLTRRIAYLIRERNVHPGSILAITFTNKAAAEMRHRVADLVGNRARLMWICTFHSACVRILRHEIDRFGLARTFSIYDDADTKRLMQQVLSELSLDPKTYSVRSVLNWVSSNKNELIDHESALARADSELDQNKARAYAEYQRRLIAASALDFDDLIMTTVHLFQAFPDLREEYRRRFRHVLVDEYQDTNHAQYALVRELCAERLDTTLNAEQSVGQPASGQPEPQISAPELLVVGDSDQSIYAFRGATIRNIEEFAGDFPGARTIVLEQNYRSTQTILNAANAVIGQNLARQPKRLWSAEGDGALITGYVADSEHDEAQFVAREIRQLERSAGVRPGEVAVFYRTNAQSRAFEELFIRVGLPYKVVGGVRFYERREVRDAIAYLRAVANPDDDVSLRRILNVPKRGIGDRAETAVAEFASANQLSFGAALRRAHEIGGLATRSVRLLDGFAEFLDAQQALVADGAPVDQVLLSVLENSGYLAQLAGSADPQDETRLENLAELIGVAREFVAEGVATAAGELPEAEPEADPAEFSLLAGSPEPDFSLGAFLERVALVADSDQIPDGESAGVVTLMTLHTAKGLEFDTVFLTGLEDSVFPHQRSLLPSESELGRAAARLRADTGSSPGPARDSQELEEERRLAYVGITRARRRLYLTRAISRTAWGTPKHNPPSRFLAEVPAHLVDWRRLESAASSWRNTSATSQTSWRPRSPRRETDSSPAFGSGRRTIAPTLELVAGDRVLHTVFGLGTVVATSGSDSDPRADIDFGSHGVKRLAVKHSPIEKL